MNMVLGFLENNNIVLIIETGSAASILYTKIENMKRQDLIQFDQIHDNESSTFKELVIKTNHNVNEIIKRLSDNNDNRFNCSIDRNKNRTEIEIEAKLQGFEENLKWNNFKFGTKWPGVVPKRR